MIAGVPPAKAKVPAAAFACAFALALGALSSCATTTVVRVTDPEFSVVVVAASGDLPGAPQAVYLGANPYRYVERQETRRTAEPVGLVVRGGEQLAHPEPPYWAVGGTTRHTLMLFPQDTPPQNLLWAVGGFYPLVREGKVVAHQFPGRTIRAARVAIAWRSRVTPEGQQERYGPPADFVVVATSGSVPWHRGLTTGELAEFILEMGMTEAFNFDGGRAAALFPATTPEGAPQVVTTSPGGTPHPPRRRLPRNPIATPVGPVLLEVFSLARNAGAHTEDHP